MSWIDLLLAIYFMGLIVGLVYMLVSNLFDESVPSIVVGALMVFFWPCIITIALILWATNFDR